MFDRSKEGSRSFGMGRLKGRKRFYVDLFSDAFNVTKLSLPGDAAPPPPLPTRAVAPFRL